MTTPNIDLIQAELKSALEGRTLNPEAHLQLNLNDFVDVLGDGADTTAIATWVEANSTQPEQLTDAEAGRRKAEERFGITIERRTEPTNDREAGKAAAARRFGNRN